MTHPILPSLPQGLTSSGDPSFPLIRGSNDACSFSLSPQGAQLLEWAPKGEPAVVWLSPHAQLTPGKSPRGGVPICWPWFGPHPDPLYPAHGVARASDWTLVEARLDNPQAHTLRFRLTPSPNMQALYPEHILLEVTYRLGSHLEIELTTHNQSHSAYQLTEALHTYFGIGDISKITIEGLDEADYIDKVDNGRRKRQQGALEISGETDRVYVSTATSCSIIDPTYGRRIRVDKTGGASTVIWNPGPEKARNLGDLGDSDYRQMICLESGNALENAICVAAGESHSLWVRYASKPL